MVGVFYEYKVLAIIQEYFNFLFIVLTNAPFILFSESTFGRSPEASVFDNTLFIMLYDVRIIKI